MKNNRPQRMDNVISENEDERIIRVFEGFSDTHVWTFNRISKMEAKSPLKINQITTARSHTNTVLQQDKKRFSDAARSLLEVCMWNIYHSASLKKIQNQL